MLIALAAMFLQQMFASVGEVLPAVLAPLVIAKLRAGPAWIGVYYGISAAASLVVQMGCGSFIVRYGALRMSQIALVLLGGGMRWRLRDRYPDSAPRRSLAAAVRRSRLRPARNCSTGFRHPAWRRSCFRSSRPPSPQAC
jgi:hypothetical protein